jgi:hypothetical protein
LVSGKPPHRSVYATSQVTAAQRLYLNTFRGEPAISGFAWHFTPTHRSSLPFAIEMGSGLHARVPHASPCPWVDHPVSGRLPATCRPFGLAFAPAPAVPALTSRRTTTRRLILQKARRHTRKECSDWLEAHGFRLSFTPLAGVLFTVPSRYWFPIGRLLYLALGRGRPSFPPDSACRMVLTVSHHTPQRRSHLRDSHPLRSAVPVPFGCRHAPVRAEGTPLHGCRTTPPRQRVPARLRLDGLGSSRFARRYSGNPLCSSGY